MLHKPARLRPGDRIATASLFWGGRGTFGAMPLGCSAIQKRVPTTAGLWLIGVREWWHDEDRGTPPRLLSLLWQRP